MQHYIPVEYFNPALLAPRKIFPDPIPEGNRTLEDMCRTFGMTEKAFEFVKKTVYQMKKADAENNGREVAYIYIVIV